MQLPWRLSQVGGMPLETALQRSLAPTGSDEQVLKGCRPNPETDATPCLATWLHPHNLHGFGPLCFATLPCAGGKQAALDAISRGQLLGFHMAHYDKGHRATDFGKWVGATEAYSVRFEEVSKL